MHENYNYYNKYCQYHQKVELQGLFEHWMQSHLLFSSPQSNIFALYVRSNFTMTARIKNIVIGKKISLTKSAFSNLGPSIIL